MMVIKLGLRNHNKVVDTGKSKRYHAVVKVITKCPNNKLGGRIVKISLSTTGATVRKVGPVSGTGSFLLLAHTYEAGDEIVVEFDPTELNQSYWVQLDAALAPSLVYFTKSPWRYRVPTDFLRVTAPDKESIYPEQAFAGQEHLLRVWPAVHQEQVEVRNLARNTYDQADDTGAYPHAFANIETRHDPTFAARNAIDGYTLNDHHGAFPYQSWGINQDPQAAFSLSFGRPVDLTQLTVVLRADFPHDSYWTQGTVTFSDGTKVLLNFNKSAAPQSFSVQKKGITGLTFDHLIKADDDSPFPALIEFEAWGTDSDEA